MKIKKFAFSIWDWWAFFSLLILIAFFIIFPFLNDNNQAIFYLGQKNYQKAQSLFLKGLEKDSFPPIYRMNLAFSYLLSKEYERSIQEYQLIVRFSKEGREFQNSLGAKQTAFYSFFNSAVSASVNQKTEQALSFYQEALQFQPLSPEVKTNIELLLRNQKSKPDSSKKDKKNEKSKNQKKQGKGKKDEKKERQARGEKGKLDEQQVKSILESIQEKEKQIKNRRRIEQNQRSRINKKDW